jgi:flagellar hook assembly protein FlgD
VGADKQVTDKTDTFSPRDTIYASVATNGSAPSATVTARWTYENGQVVKEDSRTIAPNGSETTEFHIAKLTGWPTGKYQLTLSVNGSTESKDFQVK